MANLTCLEIVRRVASRVGIGRPAAAVGSTDVQVQQLVELLNEEGQELAKRSGANWQALTREATFTTVAAEDQGALEGGTILSATAGFKYILNDTLWDRSTEYQLSPSTAPRWQADKATLPVGPYSRYRIRGGHLFMLPAPSAGLTVAFEYMTENWVRNAAEDEFRAEFTMDDDVPYLDSQLLIMGLKWRWRHAKGFAFAQDFDNYEVAVLDAVTRDKTAAPVSLNGPYDNTFQPYVVIPSGDWNQ